MKIISGQRNYTLTARFPKFRVSHKDYFCQPSTLICYKFCIGYDVVLILNLLLFARIMLGKHIINFLQVLQRFMYFVRLL